MKKILFIISLFFITSNAVMAQDGGDEKIRDKMVEYIQQRMRLNKNEAERFTPVFLRYFREWRSALKENRTDRLILQQKVVELRLRYRNEFRDIVGEKRCIEVYEHQEKFIRELHNIRQERMQDRQGPKNRIRALRL
jgi:ribosomal protein L16 Arg81 hydroxylase